MKRFSTALSAALTADNTNPSALADALKLAPSTVTRVLGGRRPASNDLVTTCCRYYQQKPKVAFALLVAHLLDIAESSGLDMGNLTVAYSESQDTLSSSPGVNEMLRIIGAEAVRTPELAKLVDDLVALCLKQNARAHDAARGKVLDFPVQSVAESPQPKFPKGASQQPTA